MRMRKKKNLVPRMEACGDWLIRDPAALRGRWRELMPEAKELRLELGCGKGRFTAGTAAAEPDMLLIAVEKVPDAMVVAMERARDAGLRNVRFIDADAALLSDMFAPGEVDRIYLNFSDPWPKSNQKKRRLTHGNFLKVYRKVLAPGGQIHFKTDNDKLFEWSLEEIPQFGFELSEVTRNLHENGPVGVMTDYEAKFYAEGKNINRCVATMVDWTDPAEERPSGRLALHVPNPDELWFRQSLLSDPATMAYNAPWFPPDGCIAFPPSEWGSFYDQWINRGPDRYYAYLRRLSDGAFVGEVDYRRSPGSDRWDMGIVISAACRGMGYGREGLRLLVEHAFAEGGVTCLQNDFETTRDAADRIHRAAGFRETGKKDGMVHLELTREEYIAR